MKPGSRRGPAAEPGTRRADRAGSGSHRQVTAGDTRPGDAARTRRFYAAYPEVQRERVERQERAEHDAILAEVRALRVEVAELRAETREGS